MANTARGHGVEARLARGPTFDSSWQKSKKNHRQLKYFVVGIGIEAQALTTCKATLR